MKRRDFIKAVAVAAVLPPAVPAPQPAAATSSLAVWEVCGKPVFGDRYRVDFSRAITVGKTLTPARTK